MDALDKKIELIEQSRTELLESFNITWTELKEATLFVNDTLALCQASARENFGDKTDPKIVIDIYDRVIQQVTAVKGTEY